jgi:2-amino-4-hydroxy-6-hydroxymethyldihydropteridine diphosphokinase
MARRNHHEMKHIIYLALGTNLGDRRANLRAAVAGLTPEVCGLAESKTYETEAWGVEDQPRFLNMALKAETELGPTELLSYIKRLETQLGRTATYRWGPRLIDIDILLYDDLVLDTPELTIPHPGLLERAFVLVPLEEIAADVLHPAIGKTMHALLAAVDRSGVEPA